MRGEERSSVYSAVVRQSLWNEHQPGTPLHIKEVLVTPSQLATCAYQLLFLHIVDVTQRKKIREASNAQVHVHLHVSSGTQ